MKNFTMKQKLFWVVMVIAPAAVYAIVLAKYPEGALIPTHLNFAGQVDGYGPPWVAMAAGLVLSASNLLVAYCAANLDKMHDAGVVHGVSKENAPKVLVGCAILVVTLALASAFLMW